MAGLSSGDSIETYFWSLVWTVSKWSLADFTNSGVVTRSRTVIATALAPATAPLWAIGVAMPMAARTWCGVVLGRLEGNRIMVVGAFQVMSPTSSEAPPAPPMALGGMSGITASARGWGLRLLTSCTALTKA